MLRMHASVVEITVQTLKKYGVFSKVQIASEPGWLALALDGPGGKNLLEASPSGHNAVYADDDRLVIQTDNDGSRHEIWVKADSATSAWSALSRATTASASLWRLRNIREGIGHVEANSTDMFIPQMLNFQITGYVHFKKGCYTGQEIVARMQYLGKLKRHMYRFVANATEAPIAGDELAIEGQSQSIGNVVSVVAIVGAIAADAGQFEVLAVTTGEASDNPTLHLRKQAHSSLRRLELPYAITVGSPKS
jgi:tRNA-modifying protein YgfZ